MKPHTILMVEDDELVGASLARNLKIRGYEVQWFSRVAEAEKALREGPAPDVLLLDREVAGADGWALAEHAKEPTRVVRMTGNPPKNAPPHFLKGSALQKLHDMIAGNG